MGIVDSRGFPAPSRCMRYGGRYIMWRTNAAKAEIRDLRSSASHLQGDLLAVERTPLEPMPEPMSAA